MKTFLLVLMVTLLFCFGITNAQSVTVSNFDGGWDNGTKVQPNVPVTWTIDVYSASIGGIRGSNNGFRVFLTSDGTPSGILNPGPGFTALFGDSISGTFETYMFSYQILYFSNDGFGADTIAFTGHGCWGPPSSPDGPAWTITTQVGDYEDAYLCLDSSFYPSVMSSI